MAYPRPHAHHIDIHIGEKYDIGGKIFDRLPGKSDHNPGTGYVAKALQRADALNAAVERTSRRMESGVQFPVAGLYAQKVAQGPCFPPAPINGFFLFSEAQGHFETAAAGENLLVICAIAFAFGFSTLKCNGRKPRLPDPFDTLSHFGSFHAVARHIPVGTADPAIAAILGADVGAFHQPAQQRFAATAGFFHFARRGKSLCPRAIVVTRKHPGEISRRDVFRSFERSFQNSAEALHFALLRLIRHSWRCRRAS